MTELSPCCGCGALTPAISGPVHAYVPSSPGCWKAFGELQADELQRFGYPPTHQIVVDTYMAQHPGDGSDRRDRQSVFVHLAGLCALLEYGRPAAAGADVLRHLVRGRPNFPLLQRANGPGDVTVLDVVGAADLRDYDARARRWARAVWASWEEHQPLIRRAVESVL